MRKEGIKRSKKYLMKPITGRVIQEVVDETNSVSNIRLLGHSYYIVEEQAVQMFRVWLLYHKDMSCRRK